MSPPVNLPHNTVVIDPAATGTLYVGTDVGVWKSPDRGVTWTHMGPETGMPNVAVFDLQLNDTTGRLVAFTHGRGAFALTTRGCGISSTVIPAAGGTFSGATSGASAVFGSCGGSGPERVFQWTPAGSGMATIQTCGTGTNFDTVLYLRTGGCTDSAADVDCNDDDDACANSTGLNIASRIRPVVLAGQTYYIVVDGYSGAQGNFSLTVTPPPTTSTTTTSRPPTTTTSTTTTSRPPTTTTSSTTTTRAPTTTTSTSTTTSTTTTTRASSTTTTASSTTSTTSPRCAVVTLGCPQTVPPNGTSVADITVDVGSRALGAYAFTLAWNPTLVTVTSVAGGSTTQFSGPPTCNVNNRTGTASCTAFQTAILTGPTGLVDIAHANLTAIGSAGSHPTLTLTVTSLFDTQGAAICIQPAGSSCTLPVALCADVNGDRLVNIADALIVAQFTVGLRQCGTAPFTNPVGCDINLDGACDIGDALRIAQCDVGLIGCAFTCRPFTCP